MTTVPVSAVTGVGFSVTTGQIGGSMAPAGHGGVQPRMSATGMPLQTAAHGTCSFPGCQFPKRIEGNKIHPYCSRTCAQKHGPMQAASFHAQKLASAGQAAKSGAQQPTAVHMAGAGPGPGGGAAPPAQQPSQNMCKNCKRQPVNPGRGWCESCYQQQQQQKP